MKSPIWSLPLAINHELKVPMRNIFALQGISSKWESKLSEIITTVCHTVYGPCKHLVHHISVQNGNWFSRKAPNLLKLWFCWFAKLGRLVPALPTWFNLTTGFLMLCHLSVTGDASEHVAIVQKYVCSPWKKASNDPGPTLQRDQFS